MLLVGVVDNVTDNCELLYELCNTVNPVSGRP